MELLKPLALFIVVADDDPEDHQLIKHALKECDQNHIVSSVFNGSQLLDLLNHRGFYKLQNPGLPDLVILDLKMPIMSGLQALEQLKNNQHLKHIPVYILTETEPGANTQKALDLGAEDFFTKPLNYSELRQLMQEVCRKASKKVL